MTNASFSSSFGAPSSRGLILAAASLLLAAITVQTVRDRGWRAYEPDTPLLWLRANPLTKRLAFGFDNLLADVYWMRAVVYYGGERRSERSKKTYDLLHPYLDLVTTLDPDFRVAYRFGAIFLAEAYPGGAGRPDLAMALLQRGLQHEPTAWEYMHDIAFLHFWSRQDYRAAAEWFDRAAQLPGAPAWLRPLAAVTLTQGGDRETARQMWRHLAESSTVDWIRSSAERRLRQLEAMDAMDRLQIVADRYQQRTGRIAGSWQELVRAERLRGVPLDPSGVPFELSPETGQVSVGRDSPLWPLPTGAPRLSR